jgi:hypothetical protein
LCIGETDNQQGRHDQQKFASFRHSGPPVLKTFSALHFKLRDILCRYGFS